MVRSSVIFLVIPVNQAIVAFRRKLLPPLLLSWVIITRHSRKVQTQQQVEPVQFRTSKFGRSIAAEKCSYHKELTSAARTFNLVVMTIAFS